MCHYKGMQRHVSATPCQALYFLANLQMEAESYCQLVSSCSKMLVQGYAFRCVLFTLKILYQGVYQDGYRDNMKKTYILFKIAYIMY